MILKTTTVIIEGQAIIIHIAAVPWTNTATKQAGFLAYSFKANTPKPTDTSGGFEITDYLFETAADALKDGLKIAKAKIRHGYSLLKKETAKNSRKKK